MISFSGGTPGFNTSAIPVRVGRKPSVCREKNKNDKVYTRSSSRGSYHSYPKFPNEFLANGSSWKFPEGNRFYAFLIPLLDLALSRETPSYHGNFVPEFLLTFYSKTLLESYVPGILACFPVSITTPKPCILRKCQRANIELAYRLRFGVTT